MNLNSLSPNVLNKIFSEWSLLTKLPTNKINDLIYRLEQMKEFGVDSFATRIVDKKGRSAMFCTHLFWPELIKDQKIANDFKKHISVELVRSYKNKTKIISRSRDQTYSPFLEQLDKAGQNNSIIINNFLEDKIEITYFMANADTPQHRDLILNNLQRLDYIKAQLQPLFKEIYKSNEFQLKKELLLSNAAINTLWKQEGVKRETVDFILENKNFSLSSREIECLSLLRTGASNRFISDELNISIETVKCHVLHLKSKLQVSSRQELIELSKNESFTNIFKILRVL
jgi:hypothetical protein